MSEQTKDNRRHARFGLVEDAIIHPPGKETPIRTLAVEIGLGGLRVRSDTALPVGGAYVVRMGDSGPGSFEVGVEVVYSSNVPGSDEHSSGLRFVGASHDQRAAIAQYVTGVFQRQAESHVGQ